MTRWGEAKDTLKFRLGRGLGIQELHASLLRGIEDLATAVGRIENRVAGTDASLARIDQRDAANRERLDAVVAATQRLEERLRVSEEERARLAREISLFRQDDELWAHDILAALSPLVPAMRRNDVVLDAAASLAMTSLDHEVPRGTANDYTRSPRFVRACEDLRSGPLHFLDLGCAGGGLVLDFALRGHLAVGLEGSDYSLRAQRAAWRLLPRQLFTCDVVKPFSLKRAPSGEKLTFDVVSAWELLEHLPAQDFPQFLANVGAHLAPGGVFVGSVATFPDTDPISGRAYHVTIQPRSWWTTLFAENGFVAAVDHPFTVADFCRGTGNGVFDWDVRTNPELGFHFVLQRIGASR